MPKYRLDMPYVTNLLHILIRIPTLLFIPTLLLSSFYAVIASFTANVNTTYLKLQKSQKVIYPTT